MYNFLKKLC